MGNAAAIYTAKLRAQYLGDGIAHAMENLGETMGRLQLPDDGAVVTIAPQNGTGAATVVRTAATKLYAVIISPSGSGGYLQLINAAAGTVGVTAFDMSLPFQANKDEAFIIYPGNQAAFGTGLCAGISTVAKTSTAIGTTVNSVTLIIAP